MSSQPSVRKPSVRKIALMGSTALTRPSSALGAMALMLGSTSAYAIDANTLPNGHEVVGGVANVSQSGARMDINQSTNRTVIDWRSFDIGSNAHVNFDQPGASAIAVNRVNASTAPSQINGALTANGNVWVLNPNGVMFGAGSRVDVSGLVASTGNINVGQFMSGSNRIDFTGGAGGSVINEGQITVSEGGMAAFVAPHVRNNGVIRARLGKVTLAAGETFTLDLAGDQLVEIGLGSSNATAEQFGQVIAEGGIVEISAKAAGGLIDSVVNVSGYTSVASATLDGGEIVLGGGTITTTASAVFNADAGDNGDGGSIIAYADDTGHYDGSFSARGGANSGDGGFVETSGDVVRIADGISVNTLAPQGETGTWSIDPETLNIIETGADQSGAEPVGTIGADTIVDNLETTSVILEARETINVNAEIDYSGKADALTNENVLALNDENDPNDGLTINLNADITLGSRQRLTGEGTTVNVNNDSVDIQDGVDVAASGATVNVAAGTYAEDVVVDKAMTLVGAGADQTTIQGQAGGQTAAVLISADNVTLGGAGTEEGFRIEGAGVRAVHLDEGVQDATIQNNTIVAAENQVALDTQGNQVGHIIQGNTFTAAGSGTTQQLVYINGAASLGAARSSEGIAIRNNAFLGTAQLALGVEAENSVIEDNEFTGDSSYASIEFWAVPTSFTGNTFNTANDVHLRSSANANTGDINYGDFASVLAGNSFSTAATIAGSDGVVASDSSSVIYGQIQSAVDNAVADDTIDVAAGSYNSFGLSDAYPDDITIQTTEGAIIDGSGLGGATGRVVDLQADGTTLSGFTITGPGVEAGTFTGVSIGGRGVTVSNNTISNVLTGIQTNSGNPTGDTNEISGNTISSAVGISLQNDGNTVAGNTINLTGDIDDLRALLGAGWTKEGFGLLRNDANSVTGANTLTGNTVNSGADSEAVAIYGGAVETEIKGNTFNIGAGGKAVAVHLAGTPASLGSSVNLDTTNNTLSVTNSVTLQNAADLAGTDGTLNLANGNYDLAGDRLEITKAGLTIRGESEAGVVIDATAVGNREGMLTTADGTTAENFTLLGPVVPTSPNSSTFGYKVSLGGTDDAGTLTTVRNVTVRGSSRSEFDFIGVNGLLVENVTADGQGTAGVGISITDSNDIVLRNITTADNAWGGVGLFTKGEFAPGGMDNVLLTGTNSLGEANPIYVDANVQEPGSPFIPTNLTLEGFTHTVRNSTFRGDAEEFTFFQRNETDAIDYAVSLGTPGDSVVRSNGASGSFFANAVDADGNFIVGTGTGGTAMDIAAAADAAGDNDTIEVRAGTYDGEIDLSNIGLSVLGDAGATVTVGEGETGFNISANDVTLSGMEIVGPHATSFTQVDWNSVSSSTFGVVVGNNVTGVTISDNTIRNTRTGVSFGTGSRATVEDNLIDNTKGSFLVRSGNTEVTPGVFVDNILMDGNSFGANGNEWDIVFFGVADGAYATSPNVDEVDYGAGIMQLSADNGGMRILDRRYGSNGILGSTPQFGNRSHIDVNAGSAFTAADDFALGNGLGNLRQPLGFIGDGIDAVVHGGFVIVQDGNYAENAVADKRVNFTFDNVSVDGLTLNAADTTIAGALSSAVNGFNFNAPVVLSGDTSITTTGTAALNTGTIDATTAGGQALTVNAGGAASLGSLGATTRLGATSIIGGGTKTLTGTTYQANSLNFEGSVFLTQALTTFNTTISNVAAGTITFAGNIFGTTDGGQSVSFIAGNGAPGSSTNGDVSLQNAGTEGVQLGTMIVTADDFSAATVNLGGNYASTLTGNQTFTDETLNADGTVTSNVGGNATGPINSGGPVTVNAGGAINGNINSGSTVNLNGQTITGNITAPGGGTVTAQTVNTNLSGGNFTVNAAGGSITGNPAGLNTAGSGTLNVNGQTVIGSSDANFNQIVVEGYVLPQGAFVTGSGEIVLPQGLSIGLISPAAGEEGEGSEPKVVFVRSVQRLGALLSEGYTAIVIDLNDGFDDSEQEIALAQ